MKKHLLGLTLIITLGTGCSCDTVTSTRSKTPDIALEIPIHGLPNHEIQGLIQVQSHPNGGVVISTTVDGLTPGAHGYHIHEAPNCNSLDGTSAKGHFNPHGHPHAGPYDQQKHVGDLGNLTADESGHAEDSIHIDNINLLIEPSLGARSFIIHEKPDDFITQPTGNSGARVACATIPNVIILQ